MAKLRVEVDPKVCVGCMACVNALPAVFTPNHHRQSLADNLDSAAPAEIIEAAEACPTGAISVFDAITGERLFPQ